MKLLRSFSLLLVLSLFAVGTALAQQPSTKGMTKVKSAKGKRVRVGKTVYDFDEVDILGKLKRPQGQSIVEPPEFVFRRLLDLDESFLPEIVRSVDEF